MLYINPPDMPKEQWLTHNATQVDEARVKNFDFENPLNEEYLPVVWVQNPGFTAAGVANDAPERDRWFGNPDDDRLKTYWLVKKEVLFALHPEYRESCGGR